MWRDLRATWGITVTIHHNFFERQTGRVSYLERDNTPLGDMHNIPGSCEVGRKGDFIICRVEKPSLDFSKAKFGVSESVRVR
jgi:hypothetical protein